MKENLKTYERVIKKVAWKLAYKDKEFQKDLRQEMRLAIWQAPEGHTFSWYIQYAKHRAIDYMRKSIPHIMVDGKYKNRMIYMGKVDSLERFEGSVRTWLSEGHRRKKQIRYGDDYEQIRG